MRWTEALDGHHLVWLEREWVYTRVSMGCWSSRDRDRDRDCDRGFCMKRWIILWLGGLDVGVFFSPPESEKEKNTATRGSAGNWECRPELEVVAVIIKNEEKRMVACMTETQYTMPSFVLDHGDYYSSCGYCGRDDDSSLAYGKDMSVHQWFQSDTLQRRYYKLCRDERRLAGMTAIHLETKDYQQLIDRGWRRSGKFLYKPNLEASCCPPYTIRLDVKVLDAIACSFLLWTTLIERFKIISMLSLCRVCSFQANHTRKVKFVGWKCAEAEIYAIKGAETIFKKVWAISQWHQHRHQHERQKQQLQ